MLHYQHGFRQDQTRYITPLILSSLCTQVSEHQALLFAKKARLCELSGVLK